VWKTIPYEVRLEIDMAWDKGEKGKAVNCFICSTKGFDLATAKRLVEQRSSQTEETELMTAPNLTSQPLGLFVEGQRPGPIPALGNAQGKAIKAATRAVCPVHPRAIMVDHRFAYRSEKWVGLTALKPMRRRFLGRCPRLVWRAPLALKMMTLPPKPNSTGNGEEPVFITRSL